MRLRSQNIGWATFIEVLGIFCMHCAVKYCWRIFLYSPCISKYSLWIFVLSDNMPMQGAINNAHFHTIYSYLHILISIRSTIMHIVPFYPCRYIILGFYHILKHTAYYDILTLYKYSLSIVLCLFSNMYIHIAL